MSATESYWTNLSTQQKVAVSLGIPACITIAYILYRRYRESKDENVAFIGEDDIEVEMKVPQEAVKLIIGRQGAIIKQLRKETGARIDVDDSENARGDRVLLISGIPVQVCRAKETIRRILSENMPVSEELLVPQRAVGRIIGRGGETIRVISKSSGAKVFCSREPDDKLALTRTITVTGTQKEVEAAKQLIQEKVLEEEALKKKVLQSVSSRCQRKQPIGVRRVDVGPGAKDEQALSHQSGDFSNSLRDVPDQCRRTQEHMLPSELQKQKASDVEDDLQASVTAPSAEDVYKFEIPSPDFSFKADEHLDVYVCASENPNHFWIQILGSRSLQLDKLATEMSQYYESYSQSLELLSVGVGDIVAAPYTHDRLWYRAKVLGILDNGNLDLYYVDFGDNGEAALGELRVLRSDFLSLPFQAIECSLAGIGPAGEQWSEEALDEFDRLTYCAEWKPLVAKLSSYSQTGVCTWPQVQLYDFSDRKSIEVGQELIRLGHAVQRPQVKEVGIGDRGDHSVTTDGTDPPQQLLEDADASRHRLFLESRRSPEELRTLSCLSLSDQSIEVLRADQEMQGTSLAPVLPLPLYSMSSSTPSRDAENPGTLTTSLYRKKAGAMQEPKDCCAEETTLEGCAEGAALLNKDSVNMKPAREVNAGTSLGEVCEISSSTSAGDSSTALSSLSSGDSLGLDSTTYSLRGCFYYLSSEEPCSSVFDSHSGSEREFSSISSCMGNSSRENASMSASREDLLDKELL
ncbi:tudor and KH domain-containing protein [Microcaecilia unicolor]|uniref:Tudor and KH domain-containing protein n=1 Tax=Microcaecilia unicolor TaxID=1415580 RepID=A0A6P7WJD4_9AMPH|nr:tudor and KH domain-containing protein [Microcaecilia unicolor]